MTAKELGRLTMADALALVVLVIEKDPEGRDRFSVRWLRRLLEEDANLTIDEVVMPATALTVLGGRGQE
jgi:hypothetical protein